MFRNLLWANGRELDTASGTRAHCRRVSAWAAFLGRECGLGPPSVALLRAAAKVHHGIGLNWSLRSLDNLLGEILPELVPPQAGSPFTVTWDPSWLFLFSRLRIFYPGNHAFALMRRVAEIAHCFDEVLESLPYQEIRPVDLTAVVESLFPDLESAAIIYKIPGRNPLTTSDIDTLAARVPISRSSAIRLWSLAADPDPQFAVLEELASHDAGLAGVLVQAANAAVFSLSRPITTVRKALLHLGVRTSKKLLVGALLRPLFRSSRQKAIWNHNLNAVEAGEAVCHFSSALQPDEVSLASLVHDIGRAAFLAQNGGAQAVLYSELSKEVSEITAVEHFLFGNDHGSIGEAILKRWSFPETLRRAVGNHHHPSPSDSLMTHALYLAEFLSESEEDVPSHARLSASARALGISFQNLVSYAPPSASSWSALRYAA